MKRPPSRQMMFSRARTMGQRRGRERARTLLKMRQAPATHSILTVARSRLNRTLQQGDPVPVDVTCASADRHCRLTC